MDNNIYGLKYTGIVWFENINEVLEVREFFKYKVDPCVW